MFYSPAEGLPESLLHGWSVKCLFSYFFVEISMFPVFSPSSPPAPAVRADSRSPSPDAPLHSQPPLGQDSCLGPKLHRVNNQAQTGSESSLVWNNKRQLPSSGVSLGGEQSKRRWISPSGKDTVSDISPPASAPGPSRAMGEGGIPSFSISELLATSTLSRADQEAGDARLKAQCIEGIRKARLEFVESAQAAMDGEVDEEVVDAVAEVFSGSRANVGLLEQRLEGIRSALEDYERGGLQLKIVDGNALRFQVGLESASQAVFAAYDTKSQIMYVAREAAQLGVDRLCLTFIHEASHHVGTEDHAYSQKSMDGKQRSIGPLVELDADDAAVNADNFVAAVVVLSDSQRNEQQDKSALQDKIVELAGLPRYERIQAARTLAITVDGEIVAPPAQAGAAPACDTGFRRERWSIGGAGDAARHGSGPGSTSPVAAWPIIDGSKLQRFLTNVRQAPLREVERRLEMAAMPEKLHAPVEAYWKRNPPQALQSSLPHEPVIADVTLDEEGELVDGAIINDGAVRKKMAMFGYMATSAQDSRNSAQAQARLATASITAGRAFEQVDAEQQQRYVEDVDECFCKGTTLPDELLDRSALRLLPHLIQRVDVLIRDSPIVLINQRDECIQHRWDAAWQRVDVKFVNDAAPGELVIKLPALPSSTPPPQVQVNREVGNLPEDGPEHAPSMPKHSAYQVRMPSGIWLTLPSPEIGVGGCEEQLFQALDLAISLHRAYGKSVLSPRQRQQAIRAMEQMIATPGGLSELLSKARAGGERMREVASQRPGVLAYTAVKARAYQNYDDAADELWKSLDHGFESRTNNLYYLDRTYRKMIDKLSAHPALLAKLLRESRSQGRSINRAIAQVLGEAHVSLGGRLDAGGEKFLNRHLDVLQKLSEGGWLGKDACEAMLTSGRSASLQNLIQRAAGEGSRTRLVSLAVARARPANSLEQTAAALQEQARIKVRTRSQAMAEYEAAKRLPIVSTQAEQEQVKQLMRKNKLPEHIAKRLVANEVGKVQGRDADDYRREADRIKLDLNRDNEKKRALHSLEQHFNKMQIPFSSVSSSGGSSGGGSSTESRSSVGSMPMNKLIGGLLGKQPSRPSSRPNCDAGRHPAPLKRVGTRRDVSGAGPLELGEMPARVALTASRSPLAPAAGGGDVLSTRAASLGKLPSSMDLASRAPPAAPAAAAGDVLSTRAASLGALPSSMDLASRAASVAPAVSQSDALTAGAPSLGKLSSLGNLGGAAGTGPVAPAASPGDSAVTQQGSLGSLSSSPDLAARATRPGTSPHDVVSADRGRFGSVRSAPHLTDGTGAAPAPLSGPGGVPVPGGRQLQRSASGTDLRGRSLDGQLQVAFNRLLKDGNLGGLDRGAGAFGRSSTDAGSFGHGSKAAPTQAGGAEGRGLAAVATGRGTFAPTAADQQTGTSTAILDGQRLLSAQRSASSGGLAAAESQGVARGLGIGSASSQTSWQGSPAEGSGGHVAGTAQQALMTVLSHSISRSHSQQNLDTYGKGQADANAVAMPLHTLPGFHADNDGNFTVPVQLQGQRYFIMGALVKGGRVLTEEGPRAVAAIPPPAPARAAQAPALVQVKHLPTGVVLHLEQSGKTLALATKFDQLKDRMLGFGVKGHTIVLGPYARGLENIQEEKAASSSMNGTSPPSRLLAMPGRPHVDEGGRNKQKQQQTNPLPWGSAERPPGYSGAWQGGTGEAGDLYSQKRRAYELAKEAANNEFVAKRVDYELAVNKALKQQEEAANKGVKKDEEVTGRTRFVVRWQGNADEGRIAAAVPAGTEADAKKIVNSVAAKAPPSSSGNKPSRSGPVLSSVQEAGEGSAGN